MPIDAQVHSFVQSNESRFLDQLKDFLRIPSVSTDPGRVADVRRAAEFVADDLRTFGIQSVEVITTSGHPVVYGEWLGAPGQPTVLVYGHYDVQPVDPENLWTSPPFEPTVRDGQIYARGASDDKGQVHIHLKAAEAHLRATGRLPINVKFVFEGEEEVGSANLDEVLRARREQFATDVVVISDTGMFARGVPSLVYGLRGIAYWQVDVIGPSSDLHSGGFGGSVANPIEVLATMLAALKDDHGRVLIPGFYDDVVPIGQQERTELARLPHNDDEYRRSLGVPALFGEEGYTTLERIWARPTLEMNGIWGGFTGDGMKTVLPARASAKLSSRLVPNQDPSKITELIETHLRRLCPPTVSMTFQCMDLAKPAMVPLDHPAVRAAARSLELAFGKRPVFQREGGSIPVVAWFEEVLGASSVLLGFGLPDCHAHAPDERFLLENYFGGIRAIAHMWQEMAR